MAKKDGPAHRVLELRCIRPALLRNMEIMLEVRKKETSYSMTPEYDIVYRSVFVSRMDELIDRLADGYESRLTDPELLEYVTFLESQVGQKLRNSEESLGTEFIEIMQEIALVADKTAIGISEKDMR